MANEEHLEMLRQDVGAWNQWRKENPEVRPDLNQAELSGADLRGANLRSTDLIQADLIQAELSGADLRGANLRLAKLIGATLVGADLSGARLIAVDFSKADLRHANFERAEVLGAQINRWTICRGIRVDTCYGSPRFKRTAQDQEFLEEWRRARGHKLLYWLWLISCDCGRSLILWASWSVLMAVFFGIIFHSLGSTSFNETSDFPWSLHKTIYYSVVTFTTLGFGDITPNTTTAAYWVMAEIILGYIMLGGLISIFATKLARRS